MDQDTRKGDPCGINNCRSRQYTLEDGLWICGNGHVQEGQLDTQVEEDYQFKGDRRALPNQDESETEKRTVLTGSKGVLLYLQAYQLILRHQLHFLTHDLNLPSELVPIVRDLWSLRLQFVKPSSSLDNEDDNGWSSSQATSSSEDEAITDDLVSQMLIGRKRKRKKARAYDPPGLLFSVCIVYLAMLLVRLPIGLGEVYQWIKTRQLLYVRAVAAIPTEMLVRMEGPKKRMFSPHTLPALGSLQVAVYRTIKFYHTKFELKVPLLNHTLMLEKFIHKLGVPLEVYPAVKRLTTKLSIRFEFEFSTSSQLKLNTFPEVKLMALLVVATKLCYGLDDTPRHARTKAEVANIHPDREVWKSLLERIVREGRGSIAGREMELDEREIYEMDGKGLDGYMDWYEQNWYSRDRGGETEQIQGFFVNHGEPLPLLAREKEDGYEQVRELNENLAQQSMVEDNGKTRKVLVGEQYPIYQHDAILLEMARLLTHAAAMLVGIDAADIERVVRTIEFRLQRILKDEEQTVSSSVRESTEVYMK